tara:strand:+ start:2033 stop:2284 length:252 start_codon:yes stop_codon:yes gene_type:complete
MDEQGNREVITVVEYKIGDLVQIVTYDYTIPPYEKPKAYYGIVVHDPYLTKFKLFPHIAVYMLESKKIEYYMPNYLEIVSSTT